MSKVVKYSKDVAKEAEDASSKTNPKELIQSTMDSIRSSGSLLAIAKLIAPNIGNKDNQDLMLRAIDATDATLKKCLDVGREMDSISNASMLKLGKLLIMNTHNEIHLFLEPSCYCF